MKTHLSVFPVPQVPELWEGEGSPFVYEREISKALQAIAWVMDKFVRVLVVQNRV